MHVLDEALEYLPVAHAPVMADRPVVAQYDPAGHAVHSLNPADAPNVPTEHEEQLVAPVVALYLPTTQLVQGVEPDEEKVPSLQTAALEVQLEAPASDVVPEAQLAQLLEPEAAA